MLRKDVKICIEYNGTEKRYIGLGDVHDEEILIEIAETLILDHCKDMDETKRVEEDLLHSQIEFRITEAYNLIIDEVKFKI